MIVFSFLPTLVYLHFKTSTVAAPYHRPTIECSVWNIERREMRVCIWVLMHECYCKNVVCMYICRYVCMNVFMCVCIYIFMDECIGVRTYGYMMCYRVASTIVKRYECLCIRLYDCHLSWCQTVNSSSAVSLAHYGVSVYNIEGREMRVCIWVLMHVCYWF